jgi:predicted transport protein
VRIFLTKGSKLIENAEEFLTEKEIQTLTEQNLQEIFGLEFVTSELQLPGFRIDTLAFNKESSAFYIIEYKKDRNFSVIDQGVAYLNLMLIHKTEFLYAYYQKTSQQLRKEDVDWSQSRIIFITPEFTKYQQQAIGFKDLGIQLWEVHKYGADTLTFSEVKPSTVTKESIATITRNSTMVKRVSNEIRVYTEDDIIRTCDDKIRDLYSELKSVVLGLGTDITIHPTKIYIAFHRKQAFTGLHPSKSKLRLDFSINISELNDPKKIARGVRHGNWSAVTIMESSEIPYALSLIKQAYERS